MNTTEIISIFLSFSAIALSCGSAFYAIRAERTWKRVDEIHERRSRANL